MLKNLLISLIGILSLTVLFSSCVSSSLQQQMSFGIWAAQKDLWDEAVFRWKKVLLLDPQSVAAHNNLAVAYEKKGLWEEAKKEYEIALHLAPQSEYMKANFKNFQEHLRSPEQDKDKKEKNEKK